MPALTEEETRELEALLADPDVELDAETRARADRALASHSEADLESRLDPDLPLMPQALAVQPATTHPEGDAAAEAEWRAGGGPDAKGVTFVYEPPLAIVKKKMLEQPEFVKALFPYRQPSPEEIASMGEDSDIYQAAADRMWRDTADATAKAGRVAYRYSRAPWLHGEDTSEVLANLGTKLTGGALPALNSVTAFVMGVDDTANFGAGKAIGDVTLAGEGESSTDGFGPATTRPGETEPHYDHPTLGRTPERFGRPKFAFVNAGEGGVEQAIEDHPVANMLGQGIGARAPWSASNRLFSAVAGPVARTIGAGRGAAAKVGAAAAAGAVGGATEQAAREAVQAGANLAETGDTGTTLGGAGQRIALAAPVAGALGAGGEVLGRLAEGGASWVRHGGHYGGAPGRFEKLGGKFELGKGPVAPPEVERTIQRARAEDIAPVDVAARDLAPAIAESATESVEAAKKAVSERNHAYFKTDEGQMLLPVTGVQEEAVRQLRRHFAPATEGGPLKAIGSPEAAKKTRALFNSEIADVSLKPSEGALKLSPDEAEAFLSRSRLDELIPKRNAEESVSATLKRRGVDSVYVTPRRYTAEQHEVLKERLQTLAADPQNPAQREAKKLYRAVLRDRDARPAKGAPGGWSAMQREHADLIDQAKSGAKLAAPGGESFAPLVDYATQRPGQAELVEAVRDAANRAGGRQQQLDQLRMLDPLGQIRSQMAIGRASVPRTLTGAVMSVGDAAILRGLYPGLLHPLGETTGPLRGGMPGVLGAIGESERRESSE